MVLTRSFEKLYHRLITGNSSEDNDYLKNGFAPVEKEVVAKDLQVDGVLPPDVNGMLESVTVTRCDGHMRYHMRGYHTPTGAFIRNGPNPLFTPIGGYHWFDGDGT